MSRSVDNYNRDDHAVRKLLGTATPPSDDTPVTLYTCPFNVEAVIIMMTIKNLSDIQDRKAKFYHDPTGTTYDDTTIVAEREVTKAEERDRVGVFLALRGGGSVGVESSVGGDLKFTIWGKERPKQ